MCGPSGTGKSHFLEALGHQAIDAGAHVSWFSLEALGVLIGRHRADGCTRRAIRKILLADVIVRNDMGLLPVSAETAEALYRVVDAAYEKRSIALSSNLHPAGFDELMDKTIANATVDRLLHHAHVVLTAGDSIRLTQATTGKGGHAPGPLAPTGRTPGHHRAVLLATPGQNHCPPTGRTHWPLTSSLPMSISNGLSVIAAAHESQVRSGPVGLPPRCLLESRGRSRCGSPTGRLVRLG